MKSEYSQVQHRFTLNFMNMKIAFRKEEKKTFCFIQFSSPRNKIELSLFWILKHYWNTNERAKEKSD